MTINHNKAGHKARFFHVLFILLIGIIGANTFTSCSSDSDSGKGGNGNGNGNGVSDGFTAGWPPSSVLVEFGIQQLDPPLGSTDREYRVSTSPDDALFINFKVNYEMKQFGHAVILANGWANDESASHSNDTESYQVYKKGNDQCTYSWSSNAGSSLIVIKNHFN